MKIKASSITNLTDARYFAAWDVSWMGFQLDTNADPHLSAGQAKEIIEWIEGPAFVGEFGIQPPHLILEACEFLPLDAIQLSPFADPAAYKSLSGKTVIQEIIVEKDTSPEVLNTDIQPFIGLADVFLLDFERNGVSWKTIKGDHPEWVDWLAGFCREQEVLLGMPFLAGDLDEIAEKLTPAGISLKGGEEEMVGVKSYDELDEILEYLNP